MNKNPNPARDRAPSPRGRRPQRPSPGSLHTAFKGWLPLRKTHNLPAPGAHRPSGRHRPHGRRTRTLAGSEHKRGAEVMGKGADGWKKGADAMDKGG